jgi:hypothetical protein
MKSGKRALLSSSLAGRICLAIAGVLLICIAIGVGAQVTLLGRWMAGACGEWAPPGWQKDARCDGSLFLVGDRAYAAARYVAGALFVTCAWFLGCVELDRDETRQR